MNKSLILKLLIPLCVLSVISLVAAYLLSETFDYSSIFLNLATDFFMIILTVYYIDRVINKEDEDRWNKIYRSVYTEILYIANNTLGDICKSLFFKKHLSIPQDFIMNLENKRGTPDSLYYIYKVKEILNTEELFELGNEITGENLIALHSSIKKCLFDLQEIYFHYGNRLSPDVINRILDYYGYFQANSDIEDLSYSIGKYFTELLELIEAIDSKYYDKFFIKPPKS